MRTESPSRPMNPDPVVVVTAADDRFALALAVMGRSLIDNLSPRRRLVIYILDGGIQARHRRQVMASWNLSRVEVRWLKPRRARLENLPIFDWYGPSIYFRLLAPELLPSAERKALYIDADTLILDDISRLWRTGLRGKPVAAAQDSGFQRIGSTDIPWAEVGIPPSGKYFNSGVLVLDLARWRQGRLTEDVLEYLRARGDDVSFPDQDALNAVFAGKWLELHPRWNLQLESASNCLRTLPRAERLLYAEAISRPGILHFVGAPKPWEKKCMHPRLFLYHIYLDRTRWCGWRPD